MNTSARLHSMLFVMPLLLALLAACSSTPQPKDRAPREEDAGVDAGLPADGGGDEDAGAQEDAGTRQDAGTPDGGGVDAGPIIPVPLDGGTVVSSTLSGRLTEAGSPYRVVGDANGVVTIPKGQVLTVEPGVILDFRGRPEVTEADVDPSSPDSVMNHQKGRVEVRVYGGIQVQGAAGKPVLLTSTNPYGWWGVNFYGASSVGDGHPVFEHMILERVRKNEYNGARDWTRAALWAYYPGPVTITHSVFRDNEASAHCGALDLMFTDGSRVEDSTFVNNRVVEIDRFAQPGTYSLSGGGAVCVTHGRNSVLRNNIFHGNSAAAFRGYLWSALEPRPLLTWPNEERRYDLGGGGALLYFQPDNDLIENNLFEGNSMALGPGAVLYVEDVGTRTVTLRNNRFVNNRAGAGGVITCNRGSGDVELVMTDGNVFTGNTLNGQPAPDTTGDCNIAP